MFMLQRLRCFSSVRQLEELHHLGRSLSRNRPNVVKSSSSFLKNTTTRTKWKYNVPPTQLQQGHAAVGYEMEALEQIHKKSYHATVLLEIRDVRLPSSSHHPSFTRLAKHRQHLVCYTHADTIDASTRNKIDQWTTQQWNNSKCIFVDCRPERKTNEMLDGFQHVYTSLIRNLSQHGCNSALTVGVPNTGKSSFLMSLLRVAKLLGEIPKSKTKVRTTNTKRGTKSCPPPAIMDQPGKTRQLQEYLLKAKNPRCYFLDVPGITPLPAFFQERPEAWYGYGAANLLVHNPHDNGQLQTQFCNYVLHCANRDGVLDYVPKLGLESPTDNIQTCLDKLANKHKHRLPPEQLQLKRCQTFLKLFNTGNFGPLILDDISKPYKPFVF